MYSYFPFSTLGSFGGMFPALQLPLTLQHLAICYVFGVFLVLKALKVVRRRPTFDLVDLLMLVILLLLIAAFIRNPVGVNEGPFPSPQRLNPGVFLCSRLQKRS